MTFKGLLYTLSGSLLVMIASSTAFLAFKTWENKGYLDTQHQARDEQYTLHDVQMGFSQMKATGFAWSITRRRTDQMAFEEGTQKTLKAVERLAKDTKSNDAKRLKADITQFSSLMSQLHEGLGEENRNPAIAMYRSQLEPLADDVNRTIATLSKQLGKRVSQATLKVDENNDFILTLALALFGVATVVGLSLSVVLVRAITAPINNLKRTIERIEQESNLQLVCEVKTMDEVGQIADSFNRMLAKIREIIARSAQSSERVAAAAMEMSAITDEARRGLDQQRSASQAVATASTELAATANEVARSADQVTIASENAHAEVRRGQQVVSETISSIETMAHEMANAADAMDKLSNDSKRIGIVMETVEAIAGQTNLLALNAAIESARAGEHGRGFAIVASEVRELATKVQKATRETQQIVLGLQASATLAIDVMQRSHNMVQSSVAQADKARHSLQGINGAVDTIRTMIAHISHSSEEQSRVTEEINDMVLNISSVAESNAHGAEQIAAAGGELSNLAEELKLLVGQFRT